MTRERAAFLGYLECVPGVAYAWQEYQAGRIPEAIWLMALNDDPKAAALYDRWRLVARRELVKGQARKARAVA
jgi:hypothetical protein